MGSDPGTIDMKVQKSLAQREEPFVQRPRTLVIPNKDMAWMAYATASRTSEIGPQFDSKVSTTKCLKITIGGADVLVRTVKPKRAAHVSSDWHWPIDVYARIIPGNISGDRSTCFIQRPPGDCT